MKPDKITITQLPDSYNDGYRMANFRITVERFGLKKVATDHKWSERLRIKV